MLQFPYSFRALAVRHAGPHGAHLPAARHRSRSLRYAAAGECTSKRGCTVHNAHNVCVCLFEFVSVVARGSREIIWHRTHRTLARTFSRSLSPIFLFRARTDFLFARWYDRDHLPAEKSEIFHWCAVSCRVRVLFTSPSRILRNPSLRRLRSYGDSAVPGVRRRSTTPGDGPPFSLCLVLAVSAWQTLEHWKADAQHWCSENS